MKFPLNSVLTVILSFLVFNAYTQQKEEVCYNPNLVKDSSKKSIKSMAVALVKGDSIKITYHSPGVRKRVIWGGLVPYEEVWVTGAHDATTLDIPFAFEVNGKEIPAGRYAFFTIPGKKEWILIINKHWQQHLASQYEEKDDLVRVRVKPSKTEHTERLQYFIEIIAPGKGVIEMAWERKKVQLPFTLKQ